MSDTPLLRGAGPTARERGLALAGLAAIAVTAALHGLAAPVGGGTAYQVAARDPNARMAVVLPPNQTVLLGLETPQTEVLAAQVRPAPAHRRETAGPEVQIVAEAPPPAMSAADAGTDVVTIEPAAPAAVAEDLLIRPEAPANLRPAR